MGRVFVQHIQGTLRPDVEVYSPLPLVLDSQSGPCRQGPLPLEAFVFIWERFYDLECFILLFLPAKY